MKRLDFLHPLAIGTAASMLLAIATSGPARAGDFTLSLDGRPIYESLDTSDDYLVEDNSYIDTYTFTGRAGQQVTIIMSSQVVDSYLILLDPNGNSVAQDDDGAGNLDARIDAVLPVDGVYTVYANSYAGGALGAYSLQASTASTHQYNTPNSINPPTNNSGNTSSSTNTQARFFCNGSGRTPQTMARSNRTGDVFPIIEWTSAWAPAPYTPSERCQAVSARLAELDNRFDRLILTAGTLNGQPVVCASSSREEARQGLCADDGLVVTTRYQEDSEDLIRGLQNSFTRIVAGTSPDILPASSAVEGAVPYVDVSSF